MCVVYEELFRKREMKDLGVCKMSEQLLINSSS